MKRIILFYFLLIICQIGDAQDTLSKQWDVRLGGLLEDGLFSTIRAQDGGYVLGGGSNSGIGGDKTQDNWDTTYNTNDYWIVRTNQYGQKIWDRRFGGLDNDVISRVRQTADGNFMLGGYSASGISGDKTQNSWGGTDYWIVKVDTNGNKLWDRRYGGPDEDDLWAMEPTRDSGFILAGTSYSDTGGDKQAPTWGPPDYWVVKIDASGNLQWEKDFGGTNADFLEDIKQTQDGGFLLGGLSLSDTGGDRTVVNPFNNYDYWVVKIDSNGNKLWDNAYGGNYGGDLRTITTLADGGFLLGGYTYSGISGDKTTPNQGGEDYWVVRIDSIGNKLWDRDYGGPQDDELKTLTVTNDGGFLLAGDSWSNAGGNKSENNTALILTWIIKTDSMGNQLWDKTIFLNNEGVVGAAFQDADGCYIVTDDNAASIGYYKTQNAWDSSDDYWMVKFCDWPLSINELPSDTLNINVYPNPFSSDVAIAIQKQGLHQATFTITNMLGQTIYSQSENNLSNTYTKILDLSYLPDGVYLVEVSVDGERVTRKIVKE